MCDAAIVVEAPKVIAAAAAPLGGHLRPAPLPFVALVPAVVAIIIAVAVVCRLGAETDAPEAARGGRAVVPQVAVAVITLEFVVLAVSVVFVKIKDSSAVAAAVRAAHNTIGNRTAAAGAALLVIAAANPKAHPRAVVVVIVRIIVAIVVVVIVVVAVAVATVALVGVVVAVVVLVVGVIGIVVLKNDLGVLPAEVAAKVAAVRGEVRPLVAGRDRDRRSRGSGRSIREESPGSPCTCTVADALPVLQSLY